jgi:hypothetical protein
MEDTHIWAIATDGTDRKEFAAIDNRQGPPPGQRTAHGQRVLPRSTSNATYARAGIYFSLAAALRIAVARFACLVRDMFAACPESGDSRRDPLEQWMA